MQLCINIGTALHVVGLADDDDGEDDDGDDAV